MYIVYTALQDDTFKGRHTCTLDKIINGFGNIFLTLKF